MEVPASLEVRHGEREPLGRIGAWRKPRIQRGAIMAAFDQAVDLRPSLTGQSGKRASSAVDTPIVVALVSSFASIVVASLSAVWTARLQRRLVAEERSVGAKAELDRYREPLLFAANELGDRIDNIRNKEFLSTYLGAHDHRRALALRSTLFRFGQYFSRLELLYANHSLMHFANDEATKTVADLLGEIGRTFAADELDRAGDPVRPRFMLWREEQHAIGEMMCKSHDGKPISNIGYASFANDYDKRYARWFTTFAEDLDSFAADLDSDAVGDSERLRRLQDGLAKLVLQLDEERAYVQLDDHGQPTRASWVTRAGKPSLRAQYRAESRPDVTPP